MSAIDHEHDCPLAHASPVPTVESVLRHRVKISVAIAKGSIDGALQSALAEEDSCALRDARRLLEGVLARLGAS